MPGCRTLQEALSRPASGDDGSLRYCARRFISGRLCRSWAGTLVSREGAAPGGWGCGRYQVGRVQSRCARLRAVLLACSGRGGLEEGDAADKHVIELLCVGPGELWRVGAQQDQAVQGDPERGGGEIGAVGS